MNKANQILNEVLEVLDGTGVPNLHWVKGQLETVQEELKNNPLPDKGLGYTIPKEMGWGKMIEIMKRHGAIPGDWQHFMQDCDTEIARHFVPEVCECPHCGSRELETGRFDPEGMVNKVECLSCKSEWLDVYKYVGIDLNP